MDSGCSIQPNPKCIKCRTHKKKYQDIKGTLILMI